MRKSVASSSFGCELMRIGSVKVHVTGGPEKPEVRTLPAHKKNPEVGDKKTVFSSDLLMEQVDAESFGDNEEVGRARIRVNTR